MCSITHVNDCIRTFAMHTRLHSMDCKRKLERLENAAEELDVVQSEARTTHNISSVFREIAGQPTPCKARERNRSIHRIRY